MVEVLQQPARYVNGSYCKDMLKLQSVNDSNDLVLYPTRKRYVEHYNVHKRVPSAPVKLFLGR